MATPQTAKQKRKRCRNCNKLFDPARNVPDQKFCEAKCRREFWTHGSAFGPMKAGLYKAIEKKYAVLARSMKMTQRELSINLTGLSNANLQLIEQLAQRIRGLREEYERHTHGFYTDGSGGDHETHRPTEVREAQAAAWRAGNELRLSTKSR